MSLNDYGDRLSADRIQRLFFQRYNAAGAHADLEHAAAADGVPQPGE